MPASSAGGVRNWLCQARHFGRRASISSGIIHRRVTRVLFARTAGLSMNPLPNRKLHIGGARAHLGWEVLDVRAAALNIVGTP